MRKKRLDPGGGIEAQRDLTSGRRAAGRSVELFEFDLTFRVGLQTVLH
jgi:hypothetical protein